MRYTLFLHYPELGPNELSEEDSKAGMVAMNDYTRALDDAGVLVSAEVLQPSTSTTTVSVKDGRVAMLDGPYVETKEQIGGIFVLDVPNLDVALDWAKKNPAAKWGTIEIRPSAVRYDDGAWRPV